jgi:PAT family beta-lactamase induction signal transducer AmpG
MDKNKMDWSVWKWIPSLYLTSGLPYIVVMSVAVAMYANLGLPNSKIALYTSYLGFAWVIKPFWSPIVVALKTKRWWIYTTQLIMGGAFAMTAFFFSSNNFVALTLAGLALIAFNSATHDIAADGIYMDALSESDQSFYVGIRSSFYRLAMITGQGGLVWLSGYFYSHNGGDYFKAWTMVFIGVGVFLAIAGLYHFWQVPKIENTSQSTSLKTVFSDFKETFVSFFKIKNIGIHLTVLLIYRLGEAQLVKLAQPFLLDSPENGGLGLMNEQIGLFYGTIGVICLTIGGILGGIIVSRQGLKKWFFPMILAINLPNALYFFLAYYTPKSYWLIGSAVGLEQFGYGFGFTAYMIYMLYIASNSGKYKTAHFAFTTGFMALGYNLPGMPAGWIQEQLGYSNFFLFVVLAMLPMVIFYKWLKIDPNFGKKS